MNEEEHIKYAVDVLSNALSQRKFSRGALNAALEVFDSDIREAFRNNGFESYDEMAERAVMMARFRLKLTHS